MTPFAGPPALAAWLGVTIAEDDPRALAILAAASSLVSGYVGQTYEDTSTTPIPDVVSQVTVMAAARVWNNPQGAQSTTVGPFQTQFGQQATGGLYLSAVEKDMLAPLKKKFTGLMTIETYKHDFDGNEMRPVANGGKLFPIGTGRDW